MRNAIRVVGDDVFVSVKHRSGPLEFVIDISDLPLVDSFPGTWCAFTRRDGKRYIKMAVGPHRKQKTYSLHREINNTPPGYQTDHIGDGDPLNNRRSNLRTATCQENSLNSRRKKRTSPIPGYWVQRNNVKLRCRKTYGVLRKSNGRDEYLGTFISKQSAWKFIRDHAAEHNPFACTTLDAKP